MADARRTPRIARQRDSRVARSGSSPTTPRTHFRKCSRASTSASTRSESSARSAPARAGDSQRGARLAAPGQPRVRHRRGDRGAGVRRAVARLVDEALAVREALSRLPDQQREILDRFFARDQSYQTIGDELGIPPGTIASRISRALAALRAELGREIPNGQGRSGATWSVLCLKCKTHCKRKLPRVVDTETHRRSAAGVDRGRRDAPHDAGRAGDDRARRKRSSLPRPVRGDAHGALANAGLEPSDELVSALRSRLA